MKNEYIGTLLRHETAWIGHGIFAMNLVETLKPETIVDLGVDYGFSTFCFAYPKIGKVYGIDWFAGDDHAGHRDTLELVNKLKLDLETQFGPLNLEFIKSDFSEAASTWDKKIDILHIDGFHSYDAVKNDFDNWSKFCDQNSVILFHDVESFPDTVGVFFNQLPGFKLIHHGSAGLGVLTFSEDKLEEVRRIIGGLHER